jgi:DNA polymerase-3 subunit delta'
MSEIYEKVIGQDRAVAQLEKSVAQPVHAYLFLGPRGSGKHYASLAFAAQLLCKEGGCGNCDICVRVLASVHPDVVVVERVGAAISVEQAREIVRVAMRSPLESDRQIIVLTDFHFVEEAAPALLKTIEEPPAGTIFLIHAEYIPAALSTIASRCLRIDFSPVSEKLIASRLAENGVEIERANEIAQLSVGSFRRAELLAHDPQALSRLRFWQSVPQQFDGTGAKLVDLTNQALATLDQAAAAIEATQEEERQEFAERMKQQGGSAGERKEFEARQKRELRRQKTDELRNGLLTIGYAYRNIAVETGNANALSAAEAVVSAEKRLLRNPNESLLLDALFAQLDTLFAQSDKMVAIATNS